MTTDTQLRPGWVCPKCELMRGDDMCDPCLGRLPGVVFACCGHGKNNGYVYFENGTIIRFQHVTSFERCSPQEVRDAKDLKEWLGQ